jgi:hypothetical protein
MNLKQAIKEDKLEEFAKEHEIKDPHPDGDSRFWKLLALMTGSSASAEASDGEPSEGSDETQTPKDISEGV